LLAAMSDPDNTPLARADKMPVHEAQRMELELILREREQTHTFQHGDFVRWKHACGPIANELLPKIVFVYWREMHFDSTIDRAMIEHLTDVERGTICDPDCIIADVSRGMLCFQVAEEAMLEPSDPLGTGI
jgi:hypothetical protein